MCSRIVMPLDGKLHLPDHVGESDSVVVTCYVSVPVACVRPIVGWVRHIPSGYVAWGRCMLVDCNKGVVGFGSAVRTRLLLLWLLVVVLVV